MDFTNLLIRANLSNIADFLLEGGEYLIEKKGKSYSERIEEAEKDVQDFFQVRFPDTDDYDEISGYYTRQTETYKEVFFEIGLLLGAKIGYQVHSRMSEL